MIRFAALLKCRPVSSPLRRRPDFFGVGAGPRCVRALTACRNSRRTAPPEPGFVCCLLPRTVSLTVRVLSVSTALPLPLARAFLFLAIGGGAGGASHFDGLCQADIRFPSRGGFRARFFLGSFLLLGLIPG